MLGISMRRRLGEGWPSRARCGRKAVAEGEDWEGHEGLIPCVGRAMGHGAAGGAEEASAGHLGVAWTSRSMGSAELEESWGGALTLWSSWSALRLRLREWMGRDSWARSSMGGRTGRKIREGKKDMADHI